MSIRVLSAADVDRVLTAATAVAAMRSAFEQLSDGSAVVPIRGRVESRHGVTLLMPAYLGGSGGLGAKIVSVFPENPERQEPAVQGAVLLLDPVTGRPRALIDGTRLTAIRTAAGSALATELLAAPDADVLAVFGAGAQARSHIELICRTRPIAEVRVVSRSGGSAERLVADLRARAATLAPPDPAAAEGRDESRVPGEADSGDSPGSTHPRLVTLRDPAAALRGAKIVVTATTSTDPVFRGGDLEAGAHVNAVGAYRPDMQELDEATILRARIVVDQREAVWEEAGDLVIPRRRGLIDENAIAAELGEIVGGRAPGGADGHELTLFKSVGNAAQDIAIAQAAVDDAERRGLGAVVPF